MGVSLSSKRRRQIQIQRDAYEVTKGKLGEILDTQGIPPSPSILLPFSPSPVALFPVPFSLQYYMYLYTNMHNRTSMLSLLWGWGWGAQTNRRMEGM